MLTLVPNYAARHSWYVCKVPTTYLLGVGGGYYTRHTWRLNSWDPYRVTFFVLFLLRLWLFIYLFPRAVVQVLFDLILFFKGRIF